MRSVVFLSNHDGLKRIADNKPDLTFFKDVHTRFGDNQWHIHVVQDTQAQKPDWLNTAASYLGGPVHVVHHKLPRQADLASVLARVGSICGAPNLRTPFYGIHEKWPEDPRCKPYRMLTDMLPALLSGGDADKLNSGFQELWQFLEWHHEQMLAIEGFRQALANYTAAEPPSPIASVGQWKMVGFSSAEAIQPLFGDDIEFCSLKDIEVVKGDRLVVLCETDQDEDGRKVSNQQLAGIEWVKKKRREGMRNPVLFVSALGRAALVQDRPSVHILTALKHPFLKLDPSRISQLGQDITSGLSKADELDSLELEFVKQAYCNPVGLVQTLVHELYSIPEGDEFQRRAARVREDAFRLLGDGKRPPNVPEDAVKGRQAMIEFVRAECNDLIAAQPNGQQTAKQKADAGWELLLLDDDIKALSTSEEPHPFVRELVEGRKLKVHLAGTSQEALDIINADKASGRNQILLAVVDYHLREDQDGIVGDQSEQGFHFVRHLANESDYIKPVLLTAMPRRFVMDSLRHLGVGLGSVFSKLDYFKEGNYSLLADQIVELGNENAEAIARLPRLASERWDTLEPFYLNHRSSADYLDKERYITSKAAHYCASLVEGKTPYVLDVKASKMTYSSVLMKDGSNRIKPKAQKQFMDILVFRRIALFFSQRTPNEVTSPNALLKKVIPSKTEKSDELGAQVVNIACALKLEEFPWNMTIEERNWLVKKMGVTWFTQTEDLEAQAIGSIVPLIRSWLATNNVALKDEDSLLWGTLTNLHRWLVKCEDQTRGDRPKTDSLDKLVNDCISVTRQHLLADGVPVNNLDGFRKRLSSLRRRIGAWKEMAVDTPVDAAELSSEENAVLDVVLKSIDKPEHAEAKSVAWEYFVRCRTAKSMLEIPKEAAKKILTVYRQERIQVDRLLKAHKDEIGRDTEPEDPWAAFEK